MNWLAKHNRKILFCSVLIINLIVTIKLRILHISTDEFGVLASAAFFTGYDWSSLVSNISYYGYGQAILYIPLFILIKDPTVLYVCLLVLNSVLISCIPIFISNILRSLLKEKNPLYIYLITFTVSVYPYYLIYSKWAYYEVLSGLIPWICIYILVKEVENTSNDWRKSFNSVILAGILAFGYATHGRLIGLIAATLVTLFLYHVVTKNKIVRYIYFIPTLVIGLVIDNYIKKYLLINLWLKDDTTKLDNTLGSTLSLLNSFDSSKIIPMIESIIGQIFYISSASFGFTIISVFLCITILIGFVKQKKQASIEVIDDKLFTITLFAIISFSIAICISVIFLIPGVTNPTGRGDYFIYGRYIENLAGPVIFVGLYKITTIKKRILLSSLSFYILLSLLILFWVSKDILERANIANLPILGILPFINNNIEAIDNISNINFLKLAIIVLIVLVLIIVLVNRKIFAMIPIILSTLFLYTYFFVSYNMIIPNSDRNYSQVTTAIKVFDKLGPLYEEYPNITLVTDNKVKSWSDSRYQFVLPHYKIDLYNGEWDSIPDGIEMNSIIISPYNLNLEEKGSDIYRVFLPGVSDVFLDENVWVYGTNIKSYLNEKLIRTLSKENNNFYRTIQIKEFSSQNDQHEHVKNNNSPNLVSNGQSGFLMYGPYMTLEKGEYRLSIDAQLIKSTQDELGFVDVVSNGGESLHKKVLVNKQLLDRKNINIDFSLKDDVKDLEIRVYTNEKVILKVNSIKILNI